MRKLTVRVERGCGQRVLEMMHERQARNVTMFSAEDRHEKSEVVMGALPNAQVDSLLSALEGLPSLQITWAPQGVFALHAPSDKPSGQVQDVQFLSASEIYLGGLQSIGSWRGFLSYAAVAGVVVWMGLYTNTIYLLTAAMLIAPFAGPAMNAALATACGDVSLLGRSLLRYFASLSVCILVSLILSLIFPINMPTVQMVAASSVSGLAILLPLAAGAAGALTLAQSDRSSLVSGAATGLLVAASLAPPAGLVGIAIALGRGTVAAVGCFVILLQVVAINVSGATIFRIVGVGPQGARFKRGSNRWFMMGLAASVLCAGGALVVQHRLMPDFRRSSRAQSAAGVAMDVVAQRQDARFVDAQGRFAPLGEAEKAALLVTVWVQSTEPTGRSRLSNDLSAAIARRLAQKGEPQAFVDVVVVAAEGDSGR